jgi:hypothetical protein
MLSPAVFRWSSVCYRALLDDSSVSLSCAAGASLLWGLVIDLVTVLRRTTLEELSERQTGSDSDFWRNRCSGLLPTLFVGVASDSDINLTELNNNRL